MNFSEYANRAQFRTRSVIVKIELVHFICKWGSFSSFCIINNSQSFCVSLVKESESVRERMYERASESQPILFDRCVDVSSFFFCHYYNININMFSSLSISQSIFYLSSLHMESFSILLVTFWSFFYDITRVYYIYIYIGTVFVCRVIQLYVIFDSRIDSEFLQSICVLLLFHLNYELINFH